MVANTYTEEEKMRRVPGITYMDGAAGRRAHVDGTGLDVWEIIRDYPAAGKDIARMLEGLDWVTPEQARTALRFYELFPDEIDERLKQEDEAWVELFGPDADA